VLDEADKMVDYNFEDAIKTIFSSIPSSIEKSN
jgi:superfamily II DNA/RNA helicase